MNRANESGLSQVKSGNNKQLNDGSTYTEEISEKVKNGDFDELKNYLYSNAPAIILKSFTKNGRSPLHDACECSEKTSKKHARELVSLMLRWLRRNKREDNDDNDCSFIDKTDRLGNTALHYAVEHRNREAVKELLDCGADVNIKNNEKKEAITPIYEHLPETIISLLDGPNSIQFVEDEDDPSDRQLKIKCNFGVITGIGNNPREVPETSMLSNVFLLDKETRVEILLNPIVQLFLDLKWSKMQYLIYISMTFHTLWSIFSSIYIMNVFMNTFGKGNNTEEIFEMLENSKENIYFNPDNSCCSITLLILTGIVTLKEIFELYSTPKIRTYFTQFENWGQWTLILSIYLLLILSKFLPVWFNYITSILAVFTAWVLVLGQLNKHPGLGLYMEMLMKVSKRFFKFFFSFSPILIAFSCVFRMIIPSEEQFSVLPPCGIVKIAAMLTGEIGFDDIIKDKEVLVVKVMIYITLLAFITIVAIGLQNLLVGLVVSDMQDLAKKARENSLSTQLEQMHLMEAFINSLLSWFPCVGPIEEMWMVTRNRWSLCSPNSFSFCKYSSKKGSKIPSEAPLSTDEPHIVEKHIKEFSKESRLRLRELKKQREASDDKNK